MENHRSPGRGPRPAGGSGPETGRRTRWRQAAASTAKPTSLWPARLAWTAATLALVTGLAVLVILPFFASQTGFIQIVIDGYDLGTLPVVPFAEHDSQAVSDAVRGRANLFSGEKFTTVDAVDEKLQQAVGGLSLKPRDALVAVVRGQAGVCGVADSPRAAIFTSDAKPGQPLSRQLVSCRDLAATLASSPAKTTLVAIDFGDLRWDPRMGVIGGLSAALLDEELKSAVSGAGPGKECWVLGSHDTFEYSAISLAAQRSLFSRALELALRGDADGREWCEGGRSGDGDGTVELDEVVRFTAAWTSAWAKKQGEVQRPVIWKLGAGRVKFDDVPRNVPIIRAPRRRLTTVSMAADLERSAGASAAPGPAPNAGAPASSPSTGAAAQPGTPDAGAAAPPAAVALPKPPAEPASSQSPDIRTLIDVRTLIEQIVDPESSAEASPLELVPHRWAEIDWLSAAIAATVPDGSDFARQAARENTSLQRDLDRFRRGDGGIDGRAMRDLERAMNSATTRKATWNAAPQRVKQGVRAANRGVDLIWSILWWRGQASGGVEDLGPFAELTTLTDRVGKLYRALEKLGRERTGASGPTGDTDAALQRVTAEVETATKNLRGAAEKRIEELLDSRADPSRSVAGLRWVAASRLPHPQASAEIARRITPPAPVPPPDGAGAGKEAPQPRPLDPLAKRETARLPADDRPIRPEAWRCLGDHAEIIRSLVANVSGTDGQVGERADTVKEAIDALRSAADPRGSAGAATPPVAIAAARLGISLADLQAAVPAAVGVAAEAGPSKPGRDGSRRGGREMDALLRIADRRDDLAGDGWGWIPDVKRSAAPLLVVSADARRLDVEQPRRASVSFGAADPRRGKISFDFDPSKLEITIAGGEAIVPDDWVDASRLFVGKDVQLDVRARVAVPPGVGSQAMLKCLFDPADGGTRTEAERTFDMPIVERLVVKVRGQDGTIEAAPAGGWLEIPLDPLAALRAGVMDTSLASLRPFPGHVTAWEIQLGNQTNRDRRVNVDLYAVAPTAASESATDGGSRPASDADWRRFLEAVSRGDDLPRNVTVVASCADLPLPESGREAAVKLVRPQPAAAPQGAAGGSASAPVEPLASTLALVVRDAAGKESSGAEPLRRWVCRFNLRTRHPRSYLDAAATWSASNRTVTIEIKPKRGDAALLPKPGRSTVVGSPLAAAVMPREADATRRSLLEVVQAKATVESPAGDMVKGRWAGADDTKAWWAIDVDGYPRAQVFGVECGPDTEGDRQREDRDRLAVAFMSPPELQAFQSTVRDIPLVLAVDGPEDLFDREKGVISVTVREAGEPRDTAKRVWAATSDRQVAYALETPEQPDSIAVKTTVSDWQVAILNRGFKDVDIIAEATLSRAGDAADPDLPSAERTVVLDGTRPTVTLPDHVTIKAGESAVTIGASDGLGGFERGGHKPGASGIDRVLWVIDNKKKKKPEEGDEAVPQGSGEFRIDLPADPPLGVGDHRLFVKAIDRVGLESDVEECLLRVLKPPPPPPKDADPESAKPEVRNDIFGRVVRGGQGQAGVTVNLSGAVAASAVSGADGGFAFQGLEPGQYQVSVPEQAVKNRLVKAAPMPVPVSGSPNTPARGVELSLD